MSRDKQVEEMARIIAKANGNEQDVAYYIPDATDLYNAGYRKSSDVAEEIFAEIDEMVITEKSNDGCAFYLDIVELAELKKKYIGEDTNVTTKESERNDG